MPQLPKTSAERAMELLASKHPGTDDAMRYFRRQGFPFPTIEEANVPAAALLAAEHGVTEPEGLQSLLTDLVIERTSFTPTKLAAYARWQNSKHVFRFDNELKDALLAQEIPEKLPSEALRRLPYPIIYVEAPLVCEEPRLRSDVDDIVFAEPDTKKGFFAFCDELEGVDLLVLMHVDSRYELRIDSLNLGKETIEEAVEDSVRATEEQVEGWFTPSPESLERLKDVLRNSLASVLNLLLYLCADNAETEVIYRPTGLSRKPKVSQAEIHEVGRRIGADLRAARVVYEREKAELGSGTKAPHIRRGHWHHFWTGPRAGERTLIVRWISPIAVNAGKDAGAESTPAVHNLKEE